MLFFFKFKLEFYTWILNLLLQDYVEPFIEIHRKGDSEIYEPMSLSKIQNRLRSNSYRHPMEFAADMRRIVTETYRYTAPKDPLIDLAGKLQSEFEMMFAKIDFQVRTPEPEATYLDDLDTLDYFLAANRWSFAVLELASRDF